MRQIIIIALLISNSLCAMTEIKGYISNKIQFPLATFEVPSPNKDPILQAAKHSDFTYFVILKLSYIKKDKVDLDLNEYNAAVVTANFDLLKYEQKTGSFTYQLSINPQAAFMKDFSFETGIHKNYKAKVYFDQTRKPDLIINGRIKDNQLVVLNNDSISLEQINGSIIFHARKKIPVTLVLNQ